LLFFELAIARNGREGTEKKTGGVGHDGGATRIDLIAGLELIEFAEGMIDGGGVAEFLDVANENGGKVGLIEFFLAVGGVLGTEAGVRIRDCHAATASAGSALLAVERGGVGNGDGCFGL